MSRTRLGRLCGALALAFAALGPSSSQAQAPETVGVLLLAHGGSETWDANVHAIAAEVNRTIPTEVALGMAARASIQAAINRLEARGVTAVTAVPLFVSSHSSVITSTEYLLGLRKEMPPDLPMFARMRHGADGADHGDDGTVPVRHKAKIRMTTALDAHPLVAGIVAERAREISEVPAAEALVLVAHGPTGAEENDRWLANLRTVGAQVRSQVPFATVDVMTVRDDAPAAIRDAATAELRSLVSQHTSQGRRVVLVPVLLSYGGIEAGIRERLHGLTYTMPAKALAPDARLAEWVRVMAGR